MNIKKYLFKNKIGLFGIVFTALLISISEVFIALSMKKSLDLIINRRFSELLYIIIYFFLVLTLSVIGYYYNGVISAYYKKNVLNSIRYDLSNQIVEMNIPEFEHYESGYILSALTTDINQLETKYLDVLLKIIRQSSSFLLSSITMLYFSIPLTITLYLFIIFLIIAPKKTYKKMQELGLKFSENSSINSTKIREILDGFETIKAFRATKKFNDQLNFLNNNCEETRYLIGKKESGILSILSGISLLTFYIPFFIGLVFISKGLIQPGVLMALINLSGSIINPIQQFGSNMANIKIGEGIFKNLLNTIINSNKSTLNTVYCKNNYIDMLNVITIQNLCFSYSNNLIFSNLSQVFENKKKYLITGTSGCGKSTLLKLLLGFYDNYQGSIKFNNIEIIDITNENFSKLVSYIPQKTFILNGSIKENIIFNSTYDSEKLITVCNSAALNETIESLPNGLDTIIGDGGRQLSGGQLQRISIARALYSNASILLVDEATSSLDDENSYNINNILLNLDKLVIHVCHKISDNQSSQYDEILSIDNLIYQLK